LHPILIVTPKNFRDEWLKNREPIKNYILKLLLVIESYMLIKGWVEKLLVLVDCEDMSLRKSYFDFFRFLKSIIEPCFPNLLKKAYLVHALPKL